MSLQLHLLGTPKSLVDGELQSLTNNRTLLLTAYLSYQEDWVGRDELVLLLWPDDPEKKARHNLSQQIYNVKKQAWLSDSGIELEAESDRYRLLVSTDVKTFREAHGAGDWARAYTTYTQSSGPLLNISLKNIPDNFENWLQLERETLQQSWFETALNYALTLEQQGKHSEANDILKQVLQQDPLAEDTLQAYIRNLHKAGQRIEAIKAFESFKEQLRLELDMEPLEQTIALMSSLENQQPNAKSSDSTASIQTTVKEAISSENQTLVTEKQENKSDDMLIQEQQLRNVPTQLTPFVGRDLGLAEIANYLNSSDTRLLTLLGPGGMGKTRLAIQTILEQATRFEDGAVFVGLAAISPQDDIQNDSIDNTNIVTTIIQEFAKALDISFVEKESQTEQLINYLRAKEMLIILDNFEHLLNASSLIVEILESCAKVKIIVTSRVALGFQSEWVYEVKGLDVPKLPHKSLDALKSDALDLVSDSRDDDSLIELHDAAQLFLRRARRIDANFRLQDGDRYLVSEICHLLGGVPLALELAANWLRVLSMEEIVEDLRNSFDLLETSQTDLPVRHHSMSDIFEQSWSRLSQQEQDALIKLSVFRGGFSKHASDQVTKIPVRTLLSLSNNAMIYRDMNGRFERHPLVYEFSKEKAQKLENPDLLQQLQTEHATYYAEFLASKEDLLYSEHEQKTIAEINSELENIRLAWHKLTSTHSGRGDHSKDLLSKTLPSFSYFYEANTMSAEGIQMIEEALAVIPKSSSTYAYLLSYKGNFLAILSHFEKAKQSLNEAWELQEDSEDQKVTAQIALHLALMYIRCDEQETAKHYLEICWKYFKDTNDDIGQARVLAAQGKASHFLGEFDQAETHYLQSLKIYRERKYTSGVINTLSQLSRVCLDLGKPETALEYAQEVYSLSKEKKVGTTNRTLLNTLAMLNWQGGDFNQAEIYVKESLRREALAGNQDNVAISYSHLGILASEQSELGAAKQYFTKSLDLFNQLGLVTRAIYILGDLGEVATKQKNFAEAKKYFYAALEKITQQSTNNPIILSTLLEFSRMLYVDNNSELAYEILLTIKTHASLKKNIKDKIDKLFEDVALSLDDTIKGTIANGCIENDLEHIVNKLLSQKDLSST